MTHRLACLDALRGLAALLVVLQHVLERIAPDLLLLRYCNIGTLGVLLFFLISGFVVPYSIRGPQPLRRFAIGRAARLLPSLWLSVAAMVALRGADWPTIAGNMIMLAGPLGVPRLTEVYWTLTFELVFYGLAAVLLHLNALKRPAVAGGMALACLALSLAGKAPALFFAYLLLGLVWRMDLLERDPQARPWALACGLATLGVGAWHGWFVPSGMPALDGWPRVTGNVLPLLVFLGVMAWRPQPGRVLLYLGAISYPVYLFQDAVIILATPLRPAHELAFTAVVVAGVLALAALVHELVEKPGMALGKRLANRLSGPQPSTVLA